MICKNCGKEIPEGSKFCIECGAQLEETKVESVKAETKENVADAPKQKNVDSKQQGSANKTTNSGETSNSDGSSGSCISTIIGIIVIAVFIFWVDPFSWFEIENGLEAEEECRSELDQNAFIITPREDQIEVEAVDGKDGNVVVKITIKDEELFEYSLYEDDDEIYYGYVPASGYSHYSYWAADEDEVKEKMGW